LHTLKVLLVPCFPEEIMPESTSDLKKVWACILAKAWADQEYKRRLLADPAAVAREEGVPIPAGLTLKVVEDAPGTRTLVLPPQPSDLQARSDREERLAAHCGSMGTLCW